MFFLLESRGFDCQLYNAAQVKALPGRPKTDLLTELSGISAGHRVDRQWASALLRLHDGLITGVEGIDLGPDIAGSGHKVRYRSVSFSSSRF